MNPLSQVCRLALVIAMLLATATSESRAEEFAQIWRYFGGLGKDLTSHILLRRTSEGYRSHFSEHLASYGSVMPYWETSHDFLAYEKRKMTLQRRRCRGLLRDHIAFPLQVMMDHGVLDQHGVREQMEIADQLSDDQITFVETLIDDPTVPDPPPAGLEGPLDAVYFDNPDGTLRKMRKKAVSWVVNAQMNGKTFKAPLEPVYAIDRKIYPHVFEIGKSALNDHLKSDMDSLEAVLPILSLEILRQISAQGLDPSQAFIFAHSVNPLNTRLYRSRYGMKVIQQITSREAILVIPFSEFLARFPPERVSGSLARLVELSGGKLTAAQALETLWRTRSRLSQGFDTAASVAERKKSESHTINFKDTSKHRMEVFGDRLRRQLLDHELSRHGLSPAERQGVRDKLLSLMNRPFAGDQFIAAETLADALDAPTRMLTRRNAVYIPVDPLDPAQGPGVKLLIQTLFQQLRESGVQDPVAWSKEEKVLIYFGHGFRRSESNAQSALRQQEWYRQLKELPPVRAELPGENSMEMYPLSEVWERVKDLPEPSEPLVRSNESLRNQLMVPRLF